MKRTKVPRMKVLKETDTEKLFRAIEKEIDDYVFSHEFLKIDQNYAIIHLLYCYEIARGRRHNPNFIAGIKNIPESALMAQSLVLESSINLIFKKSPIISNTISEQIYKVIYKDQKIQSKVMSFWDLMNIYSPFEFGCKMFSRGNFNISIKKRKVNFIPKNINTYQYNAYQHLRLDPLLARLTYLHESKQFETIPHQKLKSVDKPLHKWFYKTKFLPPDFRTPSSILISLIRQTYGKMNAYFDTPIDWNFGKYSTSDLKKFWTYLDIKCSFSLHYMDIQYSQAGFPLIYMQKESEWLHEISEGALLDLEVVNAILKDFIYNPNLSNIGVRIQPFVPVFGNFLALAPTLVDVSLIEGNYLDLQCKINKNTYDSLSNQKEKLLINEIKSNLINEKDYFVRSDIKVREDSKTLTDIDLALIEKNTSSLILLQIKWPLRPKSDLDLYKKDEEIEKGIVQAELSSEYVKNRLNTFIKSYFPEYKQNKIKHIFSFVVARDNIGTTAQHSNEFPVVDYEAFRVYLENKLTFFDMYPKLSKRDWLPKPNQNFKVNDFTFKLSKFQFSLPSIDYLENEDNYSEIFDTHLENIGIRKDFLVEINSKIKLSSEKVAKSDIYHQKGWYASHNGDLPNAIKYYMKSSEVNPNIESLNNLGAIYIQTQKFSKAKDELLKAYKINPRCEEVNLNLALLHTTLGDETRKPERSELYKKAIIYIKTAIKTNPFNFYSLYILGYLYDMIGNINRAIYYYKKSTTINIDFLDPHVKLIPLYSYKNNMDKVMIEMEHVARIKPDFPLIKYVLAGLYVRLNIFSEKSLSMIKKALHDEPDSEEIWTYLLYTLSELGDKYQAEYLNSLNVFIKQFPKSSNRKNALNELKRILKTKKNN